MHRRLSGSRFSLLLLCGLAVGACSGRQPEPQAVTLELAPVGASIDPERVSASAPVLTKLSYYLGDLRLRDEAGEWHPLLPDGEPFHLVAHRNDGSIRIPAGTVPAGRYTHLAFQVGVPPEAYADGVQRGSLDPFHGMFWTWKTGYIFLALEGQAGNTGTAGRSRFVYHVGGDASLIRAVSLPLPAAGVSSPEGITLPLTLRLDRFFRGLDLDRDATVMSGPAAPGIADRFAAAFESAAPTVQHVAVTTRR